MITNHFVKFDLKSESKIIKVISNHDFKSIDFKSFPSQATAVVPHNVHRICFEALLGHLANNHKQCLNCKKK
jgi:hypothetical protein